MISTYYNPKDGILETKFEAEITIEEILQYVRVSDFDYENPGVLKVLSDCRTARFNVKPDDLTQLVDAADNITNFHPYILDAIVVENPLDTAMTMLYEKISPVNKYKIKVFCSLEGAREWLKSFEG